MESLLRLAMAGSSRSPDPDAVLNELPTADLIGSAGIDDRDQRILTLAGTVGVYQVCGTQCRNDVDPVSPAPAEKGRTASSRIAQFLNQASTAGDKPLLLEFLRGLRDSALFLPHEFLPTALDYSEDEMRSALQPSLGERGRWLSGFRKEWSWGHGASSAESANVDDLRTLWSEGSLDERRKAMVALRRSAPELSRDLVRESWNVDKADVRSDLLETFLVGLSSDDESTLEAALDDRAQGVRQVAARLLTRLLSSNLLRRMAARADQMLSGKSSGNIRKTFSLTSTPPHELPDDWQRDGISEKPPGATGKRAHWLSSVLALVPPSHWSRRFEVEPHTLLTAIAKDDFSDAVIEGWTQAAAAFAPLDVQSAAWLVPMAEHWLKLLENTKREKFCVSIGRLRSLVEAMPAKDAEALVERALQSSAFDMSQLFAELLPVLPHPWSRHFSEFILATARATVKKFSDERASIWSPAIIHAGDAVPCEMLSPALETWQLYDGDTWECRAVAKAVEQFAERVRTRRSFGEALAQEVR